MTAWRTAVVAGVVASAGVAGTIGVAAATGMPRGDLEQLLGLLLVAATVSLVEAMGAQTLLRRASMRQRFVAVAVVSAVVALANLFARTQMMFLSSHDAARGGARPGRPAHGPQRSPGSRASRKANARGAPAPARAPRSQRPR